MVAPVKLNLKIYQGATFRETLRWESSTRKYAPISSITKAAPVEIYTTEAHGIPPGWRVRISNVGGMKEINSENYYPISNVLPGSFEINDINSLGFSNYTGGGVVEYNDPMPLIGWQGRLQIRPTLNSPEVIKELDSTNGGIIVDDVTKTITIYMSAVDTAALDFTQAVYSLELFSSSSEVIQLCSGSISLIKEVTR